MLFSGPDTILYSSVVHVLMQVAILMWALSYRRRHKSPLFTYISLAAYALFPLAGLVVVALVWHHREIVVLERATSFVAFCSVMTLLLASTQPGAYWAASCLHKHGWLKLGPTAPPILPPQPPWQP